MDLKQRSEGIHAVKWALIERFATQLILLVNMLALARMLSPKDFGLIGILYIYLAIASALVDCGMGGGLIRKQEASDQDSSTLFFFNITIAICCYALMYFAAPYIAIYYEEPSLTLLARILGLTIFINAFGLVQKILLIKSMAFKHVTRSSLYASIISTIIALLCAFNGFGIWSLLALQLTQSTMNTIFLCIYTKWWPSFSFSVNTFKELFSFGFSLLLTALLNIGFSNLYQPLIGKYYGIVYAGFYYQAKRLYEIPILSISQVVDSVTYPMLVKYQNNRGELERNYSNIITLLIFVTVPLVIMISILAKDVVVLLLGEKWMFTAQLLSILSYAGIFQILETSSGSLLKIEGRTKLILKIELLKKLVILISVLIFYKLGIVALMFGIVINSVISFSINQYFTSIRIRNYKRLILILCNALLMGAFMLLLKQVILNSFWVIITCGGTGIFIYLFLGYIQKLPEQLKLYSLLINRKTAVIKTT